MVVKEEGCAGSGEGRYRALVAVVKDAKPGTRW